MISENTNIELLLNKSNKLYTNRKLDKALTIAQEALSMSKNQHYIIGEIHSNLLLGLINTTVGKYEGAEGRFSTALEHIQQADILNQPLNGKGKNIEILLALGEVYENRQEFDDFKAMEFASAACALKHTYEGDVNFATVKEVMGILEGNTTGRFNR